MTCKPWRLDWDAPECDTNINVNLYAHQKKSLACMKSMEATGAVQYVDTCVETLNGVVTERIKKAVVHTSMGILADKVGAGKTFTMIALMNQKSDMHTIAPTNFPVYGNKNLTVNVYEDETDQVGVASPRTNLVIIPHSLKLQWEKALHVAFPKNTGNTTFKVIMYNSNIVPDAEFDNLDILVVSVRQLERLYSVTGPKQYRRIIIDEPQTFTIPWNVERMFRYQFIWFMCATPDDLYRTNKTWLKTFFGKSQTYLGTLNNSTPARGVTVRNMHSVVDASLNLPPYNETRIICSAPRYLRVLHGHVSSAALEHLNANDVRGALEVLNCGCEKTENIVSAITRHFQNKAEYERIELQKYEDMPSNLISDQCRSQKVQHHTQQLTMYERKINSIKERLAAYDKDESECPICIDALRAPRAITGCCQNSFCFKCIVQATTVSDKCPLCKQQDCIQNLIVESETEQSSKRQKTEIPLLKSEKLQEILSNRKPEQRFLVVSQHGYIFERIIHEINYHQHTQNTPNTQRARVLRGSAFEQRKIIERFENGESPIMLINTQHFGAGINLQMATDIIVYHKLPSTMLNQAIGRAQRPGRTGTLNVTYLCHENEY